MKKMLKIINAWDPIELFPMAPEDEYIYEVKEICKYISSESNVNVEGLAEKINDIFTERFGEDVYQKDIESCVELAEKILNIM